MFDQKAIPPDTVAVSQAVSQSVGLVKHHLNTFHYERRPKCLSFSWSADDLNVSVNLNTQ